jgi:UDP:flavonoid glycosyltransferase YjiC (YdhE family)
MGAILARKPMVIVPMISDQPENARRCEDLGLAKVLSLKKFNAENVWLAIRSVLEDARFQARATAVGDQFAALNGPRQGAFLLDQLARTRRPVLRSGNDGTSAAVERLGL